MFPREKNETNRLSDKLDHIESFISSDGKSLVIGMMFLKTGQTRQLLTLRENTVYQKRNETSYDSVINSVYRTL